MSNLERTLAIVLRSALAVNTYFCRLGAGSAVVKEDSQVLVDGCFVVGWEAVTNGSGNARLLSLPSHGDWCSLRKGLQRLMVDWLIKTL